MRTITHKNRNRKHKKTVRFASKHLPKRQHGGDFHLAKGSIRIYEGNEYADDDVDVDVDDTNKPKPSKRSKRSKHSKRSKRFKRPTSRKWKSMNCSPIVEGKTIVEGSCFTKDAIVQIKDAYNKNHPSNMISGDSPVQIWHQLKGKLQQCSREDCWLKEIQDVEVRRKLDEYTFAPDQPPDWMGKGKEAQWLSNFDIFNVLKQYEVIYPTFRILGPTPIDFDSPMSDTTSCVWDELCKFEVANYVGKHPKIGIVFNLDKHNKDGSHWVSMFIDLEDQFIFYLDSAGDKIPKEINVFAKRVIKQGLALSPPLKLHFYENCPTEHQYGESECGMYGLFFIIVMLTGKTDDKVFANYNEKIDFFKVRRISDTYVTRFRKRYFNIPVSFPGKK
jgi:hypothetical protein